MGRAPGICLFTGRLTGISLESGQEARRSPRGSRKLPGETRNYSFLGLKDVMVTAGVSSAVHDADTNVHTSASDIERRHLAVKGESTGSFQVSNFSQTNQHKLVSYTCGMTDTFRSLLIALAR